MRERIEREGQERKDRKRKGRKPWHRIANQGKLKASKTN